MIACSGSARSTDLHGIDFKTSWLPSLPNILLSYLLATMVICVLILPGTRHQALLKIKITCVARNLMVRWFCCPLLVGETEEHELVRRDKLYLRSNCNIFGADFPLPKICTVYKVKKIKGKPRVVHDYPGSRSAQCLWSLTLTIFNGAKVVMLICRSALL